MRNVYVRLSKVSSQFGLVSLRHIQQLLGNLSNATIYICCDLTLITQTF